MKHRYDGLTAKEWAIIHEKRPKFSRAKMAWALKFFGNDLLRQRIRSGWGGYDVSYTTSITIPYCCGVGVLEAESFRYIHELKYKLVDHFFSKRGSVLVTCNHGQYKQYKILKRNGFEVLKGWHRNPNTGNFIILLCLTFPK